MNQLTQRGQHLKSLLIKQPPVRSRSRPRHEAVADAVETEAKQLGGEVYRQRWENEITLNILIGETKVYLLRARDPLSLCLRSETDT